MHSTPQTLTPELIAARLRNGSAPHREINPYPTGLLRGAARPASVLIPFLMRDNAWHLLYIRRSRVDGDIHSGQVAFPGGGSEAQDASPAATALREAHEEIGLPVEQTRLLGMLPRFRTISNYLVTPVAALIPWPFPLRLSRNEVSRVFTVPLAWLADPANREVRPRALPGGRRMPVIYFRPYDGEIIWGATARITVALLETLGA